MNKLLISVAIVLLMGAALFGLKSEPLIPEQELPRSNNTRKVADVLPQENAPQTISVVGVGDIMTGTNYPSERYLPPNGGNTLLAPAEAILRDANITFGNLEGTILNSGGSPKRCSDPSKCYVFRMPESHVSLFVRAGFDIMSIANNHSGDMGPTGRTNTIQTLDENGILCAGLISHPVAKFERDGIRYGFIAFAPNSGTLNLRDIPGAAARVKQLAGEVDIVIVSFHGGAEGSGAEHVTRRTETYYGENRGNVYEFAHAMVDAGADIIWGHGPHVVRGMELYKGRLIAYSLGNFCTYARFSLHGIKGLAPIVKANIKPDGTFVSGQIWSFIQRGEGGPVVDPGQGALRRIQSLSRADFPESPLVIRDNGLLEKAQNQKN